MLALALTTAKTMESIDLLASSTKCTFVEEAKCPFGLSEDECNIFKSLLLSQVLEGFTIIILNNIICNIHYLHNIFMFIL